MVESEVLVKNIVEGIQEKKGKNICVVNLKKIDTAACSFFVVCNGDSARQVDAIADSVIDYVRENLQDRPIAKDGFETASWIALDYGDVMVHVMQREPRNFYNIEGLWDDGKVTWIDDVK